MMFMHLNAYAWSRVNVSGSELAATFEHSSKCAQITVNLRKSPPLFSRSGVSLKRQNKGEYPIVSAQLADPRQLVW